MTTPDTDAIRKLLEEAERAHGEYETTELGGVYDRDWPHWYASYAVEHGISDLLGHPVNIKALATLLADAYAEFSRLEPPPAEGWSGYIAARIADEL